MQNPNLKILFVLHPSKQIALANDNEYFFQFSSYFTSQEQLAQFTIPLFFKSSFAAVCNPAFPRVSHQVF